MNTKQTKRTKARQGYDLICEAAGKMEFFDAHELFRVARAIHPELKDFQPRYGVWEEVTWTGDSYPDLTGSTYLLSGGGTSDSSRMQKAFVFWREECLPRQGREMRVAVHFFYEFEPAEDCPLRKIYLDCATGLPVEFASGRRSRLRFCTAERNQEIEKYLARCQALARSELSKIEAEKCHTLFWQIDNVRSTLYQHVEVLQELTRPNSKAEWKVAREIGWRYHPSDKMEVAA